MAGIEVCDAMGAERKQYARKFVRQNSIKPQRFYKDAGEMFEESRAPGEPGYVRADIFASGIPSQPFSRMWRQRGRAPRDHPLYNEFELVCKFIIKTEPKACVLENFTAFASAEDNANYGVR